MIKQKIFGLHHLIHKSISKGSIVTNNVAGDKTQKQMVMMKVWNEWSLSEHIESKCGGNEYGDDADDDI
jgi:hypothetical protein